MLCYSMDLLLRFIQGSTEKFQDDTLKFYYGEIRIFLI